MIIVIVFVESLYNGGRPCIGMARPLMCLELYFTVSSRTLEERGRDASIEFRGAA